MEITSFAQSPEKKILLENLTYWNVETQEAYFSYTEAGIKEKMTKLLPSIMRPNPLMRISSNHFF